MACRLTQTVELRLNMAAMLAQENQVRFCRRRRYPDIARMLLLSAALVLLPAAHGLAAAGQDWFYIRNQNPLLQVFGLPPFQSAVLAAKDETRYSAVFDIANHAESAGTLSEMVQIDGESYFLTLSFRRRLAQWLEIGADLPVVSHTSGMFDNAIERWHKIWGLSNSKRNGESNELHILYVRDGMPLYDLSSSAFGVGDLQLTAAMPLWGGDRSDGRAVSLRSSLKLPTGDEKKLLGSGATDLAFGLYASSRGIVAQQDLSITGFAGILFLGEADVVAAIQESSVAFGGIAAAWQVTDRLSLVTQFYLQGSYLDSELEEVGGNSVQAGFGGTYHFRNDRTSLSLAIIEDLFGDATTDAALHVSLNWQPKK